LVGHDFVSQFERALANVVAVVTTAGGAPADILSLRISVTDKSEYAATVETIGQVYRRLMGKLFPAMALYEVKGLLEPGAKVEIEALADLGGRP
jgi:enamine deaminase RidA (YjgF/YER057c/UK114 family)